MSKTIPPTCPEPETGRQYWRSLDELAEKPEFRQWLEREFPSGASEFTDPVTRRHFVKIMSASFALAGIGLASTGCRRPIEKLEPFGKQPADFYVYGMPVFYSTAMPTRGGAAPLLAKSYDGRPIKVEGNILFPGSNGGTDRWAQASILNLYDPDRSRRFAKAGVTMRAEDAIAFLDEIGKKFAANEGRGLAFLLERNTSASRKRLQKIIAKKLPQAKWFVHEAIDLDVHRRAASQAFGASVAPVFNYDKPKVIVSLDCDFIGAEEDAHKNIAGFVNGRRMDTPQTEMNRLYVVEALMTLTGMNSDHRLRVPANAVAQVAEALSSAVSGGNVSELPAGVDPKWITECAKDLAANKGKSLVVAGYNQPIAVHVLAHTINAALGNIGQTVVLHEVEDLREGNLADFAKAAGSFEQIVIVGVNPAYNAPADVDIKQALESAKGKIVRLGYYEDDTFPYSDWHLPLAHYLESWGDAVTADGTLVPVQPLIQPLFGGLTEIEALARIAGEEKTSPYDIVRETFAEISGSKDDSAWKKFLYTGFLEGSAAKPANVSPKRNASSSAAKAVPVSKDSLEVIFYRDYKVDDGRYSNNGWLQELPDPVTKLVWDNTVMMSRKTARDLGVKSSDVVEVKVGSRSVRGPVWVQPGMADYVVGLALGYGREWNGRIGYKVGFDAYTLRTTETANFVTGATISKTSETYPLSTTQNHWSMEGRPIIREANLGDYRDNPEFVKNMDAEKPPGGDRPMYPNPFDFNEKMGRPAGHHQWGMSVDLTACVGCSTCVLACQSENNVPIVGKNLVGRGREMHWMRIDRYYTGDMAKHRWNGIRADNETFHDTDQQQFEEWIDDPQVITQPMFCQHCEAAPCENVCPVNATVHDQEGLNLMVYNRCVGTRYCSNNCPYKVRRFNFLDYNKRSLQELKGPFYPPFWAKGAFAKFVENPQDPTAGMRRDDEWDLYKMIKNPDVTVRMRGVMEKCTYCIQRIQQAEIAQKVKARESGDVLVPDGAESKDPTALKTACQQACPANALVFGNINDPNSKVSKLKAQQRNYSVLDFLLTKPRTTYLAKLRNPNPAMPDFIAHQQPYSIEEYKARHRNESPFEKHAEEGGAEGEAAGKGAK
ncbi:MAG TPA: TAT-variant-translocated molybdopterin oxidoreductase [Candidatus Angelobacter sp.]|nr:TAT-variant-translocated molybdopterin oxidoreductase [Candidatus Angelobacter sp.]